MMRMHYAGGSELTGTDIANAVLDLAEQLALNGTASTVDIPVLTREGNVGHSRLLLGPASQIIAETEESDAEELRDDELVTAIGKRANALRPHPVRLVRDDEVIDFDPDTDINALNW